MVGGGTEAHAEQMLDKMVCRAFVIAGDDMVYCCQTDAATVRAAQETGLSVARYLAWQQLKQLDPAASPEDALALEISEVRALAGLPKRKLPLSTRKKRGLKQICLCSFGRTFPDDAPNPC